jgi:hypothetical protein
MSTAIEQTHYRNSISRPFPGASGVLSESALYIMQTDSGWKDAIDELLRIRNYEVDFDGEGSFPPPIEIVDTAINFSRRLKNNQLPAPNRVSASINGTIVFEWYFPHLYHQLEFDSPNEAEATFINKDDSNATLYRVLI